MSFQIGRSYGNYEIIDVLHSSREGITYKVRNNIVGRLEAMKVLPGYAQNDQEALERFLREIRVHAGMTHPNIIGFYNAAELENRLVMTSELVEGVTLAERLELGPLRWKDATTYLGHVLSALTYAHERGIVHRDLNPSRIILTPGGPARLNGFSRAKGLGESHLTMVGAVVGSLGYISPEQVKGIERPDGRSDIYSAGAVLYEALTGRPPFQAKSQFELMSAHVNAIPAPPSSLRRSIPPDLDAAVLKALAKEPAERFQSATQFRQALELVGAADGATTEVQSLDPAPPMPALKPELAAETVVAPARPVDAVIAAEESVAQPELVSPEIHLEPAETVEPVSETVVAQDAVQPPETLAGPPATTLEPAVVQEAAAAEAVAPAETPADPPATPEPVITQEAAAAEAVASAETPADPPATPEPVITQEEAAAEAVAPAEIPAEPSATPEPVVAQETGAAEAVAPAEVPDEPAPEAEPVDELVGQAFSPAHPDGQAETPAPPKAAAADAVAPAETPAEPGAALEAALQEVAAASELAAESETPPQPASDTVIAAPGPEESELAAEPPPDPQAEAAPQAAPPPPPPYAWPVTAPQILRDRPLPPHTSSHLPIDVPLSEPVVAPPSATPVPRELMFAALLLFLVGIAAFFAFR